MSPLALAAIALGLSINTASFTRDTPCDLPGHDLEASSKQAVVDDCQALCSANRACEAYVYVTGWKRCFLKRQAGRVSPVRFYSGVVADGRVFEAGFDRDYTGKDLRRVNHIASGEDCGRLCAAEPQCKAFAYIGGNGDCWLKQTIGTRLEKVFHCGIKKH